MHSSGEYTRERLGFLSAINVAQPLVNGCRTGRRVCYSRSRWNLATTKRAAKVMIESQSSLPVDVPHCEALTRRWVRDFVLALQLCPYARAPFLANQVRIAVDGATSIQQVERALEREAQVLQHAPEEALATTLLVLPNFHPRDFERFYASTLLLERRWEARGLSDSFVLVFFHPMHMYAKHGAPANGCIPVDQLDYERRAPLPTINLLRDDQVDAAVASGKSTEMLEHNAAHLSTIPLEALEIRFRCLYKTDA